MRIKITLASCNKGAIDFNYQHQIQELIYKEFLAKSNPEYASSLHRHGYVYERDKRFKLFVFSGILFHKPIRPAHGFTFNGTLSDSFTRSFQIASPINEFIQYLIVGIFKEGQEIKLGRQRLNVYCVETLSDPLEHIGSRV